MIINIISTKKILLGVFNVIIMFTFIYPLHFVFFPLSTRYILALVGIACLITKRKLISKYIIGVSRFMPVLIFSLVTTLVNQTSDFGLWLTPIVYSLSFFSVIGVVRITKSDKPLKFVDLFILAVLLQMIISLVFFLQPDMEMAVNKMLVTTDLAKAAMESSQGIRLRGLGAAFFSSGVVNSISLLLIAIYYQPARKIYLIAYFAIFIIGLFVSRTTVVGFLLSLPLLLKKLNVSFVKILLGAGFLIGGLYLIGTNLKNSEEQRYLNLFNFGFAIINDYENSEKLNTGDLDAISYSGHMPDNIKTWIIGDGLLADPIRPTTAYYKNVDQGYLRGLYFFGLFGTLSLIGGYCIEVRQVVRHNKNKLFYLLYLLYLIVMYKGLIDLFQFIIPFYLICNRNIFENKGFA